MYFGEKLIKCHFHLRQTTPSTTRMQASQGFQAASHVHLSTNFHWSVTLSKTIVSFTRNGYAVTFESIATGSNLTPSSGEFCGGRFVVVANWPN